MMSAPHASVGISEPGVIVRAPDPDSLTHTGVMIGLISGDGGELVFLVAIESVVLGGIAHAPVCRITV